MLKWLRKKPVEKPVAARRAVRTLASMAEHNHSSEDILEGMQFSATLQLRTPLAILMQDGEVLPVGVEPALPPQRWMGVWMEKTRAFRAPDMDLPELRPTVASYIGPVYRDEYLPFLKAVRGPYEAGDQAGVRDACAIPKFQDFVMRHGGVSNILSELDGNYRLLAEKDDLASSNPKSKSPRS